MPHAIDISAPMTQILWCSPAAAALTSARSARCACDGMSFMGVVVAMLSIVIWLEKRAAWMRVELRRPTQVPSGG